MLFQQVDNLTYTTDNVPQVVDTNRQQNIVGTRLCANLINPPIQELYNAIVAMGLTPSVANNQLATILENMRDNVASVSKQITQETTDRQTAATSDKQALTGLINQNSTAISGINTQLATLSATTDSFNSNIAQQITNSQNQIGASISDVQSQVNTNANGIATLNTINQFREVSLSDSDTGVTHDFNSQAVLIVDVGDASNNYTITAQTSAIGGTGASLCCRARIILTGINKNTTFQVTYNGHTSRFDVSSLTSNTVTRQYEVTFAGNGKAYCAEFMPDPVLGQ